MRTALRLALVLFAIATANFIWHTQYGTGGLRTLSGSLPVITFLLAMLLHTGLMTYGMRMTYGRFERFLMENSWQICFRCAYVLKGLPSPHQCPECDRLFEYQRLEKAWRQWLEKQLVYSYANQSSHNAEQPTTSQIDSQRSESQDKVLPKDTQTVYDTPSLRGKNK